jgi:hypothetical protein
VRGQEYPPRRAIRAPGLTVRRSGITPQRSGAPKAPGPSEGPGITLAARRDKSSWPQVRGPGSTPGGALAMRTWSFLSGQFLRTTAITGRPPRKAHPFLRIAAITAGIYLQTLDRLHGPPGAVSSHEVQGGRPPTKGCFNCDTARHARLVPRAVPTSDRNHRAPSTEGTPVPANRRNHGWG